MYLFLFRPFVMKKIKNEYFSDNPGFLGYKVNISFLTENYHILKFVVEKCVRSKKNGVYAKIKSHYARKAQRLNMQRAMLFPMTVVSPAMTDTDVFKEMQTANHLPRDTLKINRTATLLNTFLEPTGIFCSQCPLIIRA